MSWDLFLFYFFRFNFIANARAHQVDRFRCGINQANESQSQTNIRFTAVKANQLRSSRFATFDTAQPDAAAAAQIQKVFE